MDNNNEMSVARLRKTFTRQGIQLTPFLLGNESRPSVGKHTLVGVLGGNAMEWPHEILHALSFSKQDINSSTYVWPDVEWDQSLAEV